LHALLPEKSQAVAVLWNGKPVRFKNREIEKSVYVDAEGMVPNHAEVEIQYED
jgi:hypothetical protein